MTILCRVLMVYPKFIPNSFWNYTEACELVGAKYPAAPLGQGERVGYLEMPERRNERDLGREAVKQIHASGICLVPEAPTEGH